MHLFPYREESDPDLIRAATAAYQEAPPANNTRRSQFSRTLGHDKPSETSSRRPVDSTNIPA
jgi:hypothetical protein